jgi:hypothetical protein
MRLALRIASRARRQFARLTPRDMETRGFFAGVRQARLMRSRIDVFRTIGDWLGSFSDLKRLAIRAGSAPRRHAFVISRLKPDEALEPYRHRYTCLDCRWSFLVDARGRVVAVDAADRLIAADEAMRRLASFADSSCPGSRTQSGIPNPPYARGWMPKRRVPHLAWSAVASRFNPAKNQRARQSR